MVVVVVVVGLVVVCVVCVVIVMGGRLSVSEHGWDPKKARPKHRVEMLCGDVCESYFRFTCAGNALLVADLPPVTVLCCRGSGAPLVL